LNNIYIKLINFDFSLERCHLISVSFHTTPHIPPAQPRTTTQNGRRPQGQRAQRCARDLSFFSFSDSNMAATDFNVNNTNGGVWTTTMPMTTTAVAAAAMMHGQQPAATANENKDSNNGCCCCCQQGRRW